MAAVTESRPSPGGLPTESQEGLLGAPSVEEIPDQDLFAVPEVNSESVENVESQSPEPASPRQERSGVTVVSSAPAAEVTLEDRLAAELRELSDIVNASDSLQYLRSRLQRALEEGADAITLVSFYRLVVRSLSEGTEQARRDFESMRSKASKLELELATSLAQGGVGQPARGEAAISEVSSEKVRTLEQELIQANEQREKLLLDFKHVRERAQKDLDIRLFKEKEKFFKSFLPVLDSFERAQQSLNESSSVASLLEGFRLIGNQLMEALGGEGLEPVDTNCLFDPRFHEAVGEVENEEKPDEWVYDELSRGYRLGERLIRPAMVRLSRNPRGILPSSPDPEPESS